MGHFDGQGRSGRDFQSGLKPFRHQMFYSRGLSEAFPDRHENTGHSLWSWVTRMGSAVSGRRELEGKSQSLRVSTRGSGWKGPRYQSSWGSHDNSETFLWGRQSWKCSLKMAWVVEKDAGRELQIEEPSLNVMVGSNERWKWCHVGR